MLTAEFCAIKISHGLSHIVSGNNMKIDFLGNWPEFIPELAALLHNEWADLYAAAGIAEEDLRNILLQR